MKLDKWGVGEESISAGPGNVIIEDTSHSPPLLEGRGFLALQTEQEGVRLS